MSTFFFFKDDVGAEGSSKDSHSSSSGGSEGIRGSRAGGRGLGAGRISIAPSDFELIEETERPARLVDPQELGSLNAIGVHGFKVLKFLRSHVDRQGMLAEGDMTSPLITVS